MGGGIRKVSSLLSGALLLVWPVASAPPGFPASGNGLWYSKPAGVWSREWLPVGNGYLAAMTPGGTTRETLQLNIESLWTGGPFEDPSYNGGNKKEAEAAAAASALSRYKQAIFDSADGEIEDIFDLTTDAGAYGSYAGAGYLITQYNNTTPISNYARWLDLDDGVARTTWTQGGSGFIRETFCSHPTQSCTQRLAKTVSTGSAASPMEETNFWFSPFAESGYPAPNVTCPNPSTLQIRGRISNPKGMLYEMVANVRATGPNSSVRCLVYPVPFGAPFNATISVTNATELWVTWVGGTEYSMDAGMDSTAFSFKGSDPHDSLVKLISGASPSSGEYSTIRQQHVTDFRAAVNSRFALSLGQTSQVNEPTDVLKANYKVDSGNPYLEWILFNYGRYLLASSGRGVLPVNLQGKWAHGYGNAWSADYHANINVQMNYWSADMTNLDVNRPLFDYMEKTWAPRGAYTAKVLYNITRGWVTHHEMNIFGHTGMKAYGGGNENGNSAQWANYPEAAVWMMLHVWDHFDYTHDVAWWKSQGWPLLKGVALFQLDKLIADLHFNDNTLVVNPCNSPEQVPITFGCAHAQQMIWQLFNAVEKGFNAAGDTDTAFLAEVQKKRSQMDKGLRIGSWGQLQEWKVEKDSPSDTHRHLSHLIGLYPGYAIAQYDPAIQGGVLVNGSRVIYTKDQILKAASTSLMHRGNGTGPDADSGWEKAWRAAAWAQLGSSTQFYHILTYAIAENFGANLFSLYNPYAEDPIFQIDANLAYPAAVMNALIQAPDVPSLSSTLIVALLPALPSQWAASGNIRGARIRGGMTLDFSWSNGRVSDVTIRVDASTIIPRKVQLLEKGELLRGFTTGSGLVVRYP